MSVTTPIAMFGWPAVVLLLFAVMPARRAVIVAYVIGWLFLPTAVFWFTGLPPYGKLAVTSLSVLLAVLLFDQGRVLTFRARWLDLSMVVWCAVPFVSSITNGLGVKDGVLEVFNQTVAWGVPYFIGRLYFSDREGLRELAIGIFIGGLIYVPFCLWEIRMSPGLHRQVYGFSFPGRTVMRFGGYRPAVFLQAGLALGMWMTAASCTGFWLWRTRAVRNLYQVPVSLLATVLLITTVLCKSLGALVLLVAGTGALTSTKWIGRWLVLSLVIVPLLYCSAKIVTGWQGRELVTLASMIDEDRALSLQFRHHNEALLIENALQRPLFGWGGWSRNRPWDELRGNRAITDGLWVIAFGKRGLVGLTSLACVMLLPSLLLFIRISAIEISSAAAAGPVVLAVIVVLVAIDSLLNAMLNPIFVLPMGGLTGFVAGFRGFALSDRLRASS